MSASKMDVSQLESGVFVYVCAMETIKGEILQKKFIKEEFSYPAILTNESALESRSQPLVNSNMEHQILQQSF